MRFALHSSAGIMSFVRLRERSETHTDRSSRDRRLSVGFCWFDYPWSRDRLESVGFDGSVSLCHALRGTLPLRVYDFDNDSELDLRDVSPSLKDVELST